MQCKSLLCVVRHVPRDQANDVTYVDFKILFVCSLAWEESVAIVEVSVVDAIRWTRGRSELIRGARGVSVLVGLIVNW